MTVKGVQECESMVNEAKRKSEQIAESDHHTKMRRDSARERSGGPWGTAGHTERESEENSQENERHTGQQAYMQS